MSSYACEDAYEELLKVCKCPDLGNAREDIKLSGKSQETLVVALSEGSGSKRPDGR